MLRKALITVSWSDDADQTSACQAAEFGCQDIIERLEFKSIANPSFEIVFDPVPRPAIGVAAIVIKDGRLLMVRRAGAHGAGTWCPPGGWIEFGEEPGQTAEREVHEETNVVVEADKRILPYTSSVFVEESLHTYVLFILCRYASGVATAVEPKSPVVEWVPLSDVIKRDLFMPFKELLAKYPTILDYCARSTPADS